MKSIAFFQFSTEEDLSFVLEFSGLVLSGRDFEIKVTERASNTTKATLTNGDGITVTGANILEVAYAKAGMTGWARGEYSADVVDVTGGGASRIQAVRFDYNLPGRLVQGVQDRKAYISWSPNQAVVTSTGAIGPKGAKGDKGDTGEQGEQGETGPSGTIAVGEVTTGVAGSDASVTNVGTPTAAIFDFEIPEGAQGIQGLTGNKGWSPSFAVVSDGTRRVLQVDDWAGGEGTKPATGDYVGASGLTSVIGDAVDIRGPAGTATIPDGNKGDITSANSGDTWTLNDGVVDVAKLAASVRASGSTPDTDSEKLSTPEDVVRRIQATDVNDQSSEPGNASKFWTEYFGTPGTGRVQRLNRLFVGVAAQASGDRPLTDTTWVDDYFDIITDSQLAAVSALGSLAVVGVSRTSDFSAWTGGAAGGAQGVSGFAVNDDPVYSGVAVAVYGETIHKLNAAGITESAEFVISSGEPVVDVNPNIGITAKTTFSLNLTAGFRAAYNEDISCALTMGGNHNGVKFRKGIVPVASGFDTTVGAGGGGVIAELPLGMSVRWVDASGTAKGEIWADGDGLKLDDVGWKAWTPTISAGSGSITSQTTVARYKRIGKTLHFNVNITINTNGTGSGSVGFTLPFTPAFNSIAFGREGAVTGAALQAVMSASNAVVAVLDSATGGYPGGDGRRLDVTGTVEVL